MLYIQYFREDISKRFSNFFYLLAFTREVCTDRIFTSNRTRATNTGFYELRLNLSNILPLSPLPAVINVRQF